MTVSSGWQRLVTSDVSIRRALNLGERKMERKERGEKEVASFTSARLSGRREAPDGSGEEEQACKQAQLRRHQDRDRQTGDHGHDGAILDVLLRHGVADQADDAEDDQGGLCGG